MFSNHLLTNRSRGISCVGRVVACWKICPSSRLERFLRRQLGIIQH